MFLLLLLQCLLSCLLLLCPCASVVKYLLESGCRVRPLACNSVIALATTGTIRSVAAAVAIAVVCIVAVLSAAASH